jgi:FkbM family methyltransferase
VNKPAHNTPGDPFCLPLALRLLARAEFPYKLGLCEHIFGSRLSKYGVGWVRTSPGPVWRLDLANPTHRWIVYGGYEGPSLWRWLRANRASIGTIVDSGANIGQTLLYFAAYLPQARIIAYEPGREARSWVEEGIAANGFASVTVVAAGLSSEPGSSHLGSAGVAETHGSWNRIHPTEGEAISLVVLDRELERLGIQRVDLWKLDVEGHEYEALRGASGSLAAHRIRAIYMELGDTRNECVTLLSQHGYTGWNIRDSGRLDPLAGPMTQWGNALFVAPT